MSDTLQEAPERVVAGSLGVGEALRDLFPVLERKICLNANSQGALSTRVRAAYLGYLDAMDDEGARWDYWIGRQEEVRTLTAQLLGTLRENVAITPNVSVGLSSLASSLDPSSGRDTIVTTGLEFPTVGQIWHANERRGLRVKHVEAGPDGVLDPADIEAAIDDRTALVSTTWACYRDGSLVDIDRVVEVAHAQGVPVHVDAYQALGGMPLDVSVTPVDFLSGGYLKYLLGSPGAAFLYVSPDAGDRLVPVQTGWLAARNIDEMGIYEYDPALDARRFEGGTPGVPSLYAAEAGLELMLEIGLAESQAHIESLLQQLRAGLADLGGVVVTPERSHGPMLALRVKDEWQAVGELAQADVVLTSRDSNLRIAPHCYNTIEDIDRFLAALSKRRHLLA